MPELPEVETTVRDLRKKVLGRIVEDIWCDFKKMIKKPANFEQFKKELKSKKIRKIWRRGKNILLDLSDGRTLLIHQKLTGHLLLGEWELKKGEWEAKIPGPLSADPTNKFLHLIFFLDNGQMLTLSDLRKFAKVELWDKKELGEELKSLGPEPLEKSFTFKKFKEALKGQKRKIKQVLMDQEVMAGIGNIYSDEILFEAKVNPFKETKRLNNKEAKKVYTAMGKILKKAIAVKGESISDFRRISGEKGEFDSLRKVYRREGEKCPGCGTKIVRKKIAGRSVHFCPQCQKV